ncbi:Serine/threonine-protein kinase 1 [Psilocybe cubensis]|uniref:Serine/threonine-protein kinase 1 n=2 Tax=Psilocybe cubensis TaxID=181762 RepID=A0ACB8GPB3_PSICU|nr:Serine/threonine-protein kinase 1 [Psilocybe cubensis]KAH9477406.1 Serine/threonine-protein kinase 1 [Psilocybe cubensis]
MESPPLKVTFSFKAGQGGSDDPERQEFWDSPHTIEWFKLRGYTLYRRGYATYSTGATLPTDSSYPVFPPESDSEFVDVEYPYSSYDITFNVRKGCPPQPPLGAREMTGKVVFAQDTHKRHVAIKIVHADTDEYRVLRFLSQQNLEVLKENCILPVLDLLPNDGFWFAVMPRFEIIDIMHSCLKGLSYLHEHNIVHGDIRFENVLLSHFSNMSNEDFKVINVWCKERREDRLIRYALCDYDISIMFPPTANKKECRLPHYESWGTFNLSYDTAGGEYDYDPFALDVGGLGVQFAQRFGLLAAKIHFLAPLIDKMTTWDISQRFTASEALIFFEERLAEVPEEELCDYSGAISPHKAYLEWDIWEDVPAEFAEEWKSYRTPPIPWHLRTFRFLDRHLSRLNPYILPKTRFYLSCLSSVFKTVYSSVFSSKIAI